MSVGLDAAFEVNSKGRSRPSAPVQSTRATDLAVFRKTAHELAESAMPLGRMGARATVQERA